MAGADRLCGRDGHIHLGEALAFESGGEGDQPWIVPDRQRGNGGGVNATGQKRPDGDIRAHVFGHRILKHLGDLVVASLLAATTERHRGKTWPKIPAHLRRTPWADHRIASGFQPAHTPMQCFGFGDILQNRVVLQGTLIDTEVQTQTGGQVEQAFFLAADRGAARTGRHEQRLDAERVARTEQLPALGIPEGEGEHAPQTAQCLDAPIVIGGDDGLTITIGGKGGPVLFGEFGPQFQIVVDLAVEDQHIPGGRGGRPPAQWLM